MIGVKFHSRKSMLLGVILWPLLVASFYYTGHFISMSQSSSYLASWLIVFSLTGFIWFGLKYIIDESALVVKIGPIPVLKIPIDQITKISRSYNPISSPAASMKRIKIDYKGGSVLLSPNRELEFCEQLRRVNKHIDIEKKLSKVKKGKFIECIL